MSRIDQKTRDEAARLLAEGRTPEWIGTRLHISATTIRAWRRNNAQFQQLYAKYLESLHGRGLLLVAQRGRSIALKSKAGVSAAEAFRGALVDMARKDSRRTDGGHFNNQENS